MPYVLLNRELHDQPHPCVKTNNFLAAYLAGQYLIRKGHVKIIHLTRKHSVPAVEERIEGLKKAFDERGISFRDEQIFRHCEINIESGYQATREILRQHSDFSAILAFNDIIAFGVMKALREAHLQIPDEMAVMGFDNLIFSDICLSPLTSVNQNLCAIGMVAMERLLQQIEGENAVTPTELPKPYIVERESA